MISRFIAVVPARSGSKGLPGKNKKILSGRPLILHTIDAALRVAKINQIIVSTNDKEIIDLFKDKKYNSITVDFRPESLSGDSVEMYEVIEHVIKKNELIDNDYIVLLQPTSPLRNDIDIAEAIDRLEKGEKKALISVTKSDSSILKSCFINDNKLIGISSNQFIFKNRQSLPHVYKPNGAIYIYKVKDLKDSNGFHLHNVMAYCMSEEKSLDIDNMSDFELIEEILN